MKITGLNLYAMTDEQKGGIIPLDKEDEETILGIIYAKYNKIEIKEIPELKEISLEEIRNNN